ncbi:unnamed protein product [Dovyalis caffra]|uniref:RNase H type-1 domain-containing protein n=1 Tax=Dovyalis caffra TaxID=77055 RepID=A0AAV1RR24_9ROSI|nr:unnamed protein product [Dovyalis caffra]
MGIQRLEDIWGDRGKGSSSLLYPPPLWISIAISNIIEAIEEVAGLLISLLDDLLMTNLMLLTVSLNQTPQILSINWLNNASCTPCKPKFLLHAINSVKRYFAIISFIHAPREANTTANFLAQVVVPRAEDLIARL